MFGKAFLATQGVAHAPPSDAISPRGARRRLAGAEMRLARFVDGPFNRGPWYDYGSAPPSTRRAIRSAPRASSRLRGDRRASGVQCRATARVSRNPHSAAGPERDRRLSMDARPRGRRHRGRRKRAPSAYDKAEACGFKCRASIWPGTRGHGARISLIFLPRPKY